MNLTDKEILELNELCNALVDETITESQQERLTRWLGSSAEARRYYVRCMGMSASLYDYASEMQVEARDAAVPPGKIIFAPSWWIGSLAAAAAVVLAVWWAGRFSQGNVNPPAVVESEPEEFVARLTGSKNCQWGESVSLQAGDPLQRSQRLELTRGVAEITFDCGALVVLEAPATLELNSAWEATLQQGTLKATVPHEAIGFRISNPAVQVVDLGTEFSMVAAHGSTEVYVLKGEVEASPRDAGGREQDAIVLRENQSRRFEPSGASEIQDTDQKIKRFKQKNKFDRPQPPAHYLHWSFDETDGQVALGETSGTGPRPVQAQIVFGSDSQSSSLHVEGVTHRALQFDGQTSVNAPVPELSAHLPRTVAFWIRVPTDAPLSDTSVMMGWILRHGGDHPLQVSWNRDPAAGVLGALRTDFDRGMAIGTTPLRDGKWHHVAVELVSAPHREAPLHVKQYMDGRLEGAAVKISRKHRPVPRQKPETIEATRDVLWLGRAAGKPRPDEKNFRGALDELFVADRPLVPQEILQLMHENKPQLTEVVAETGAR